MQYGFLMLTVFGINKKRWRSKSKKIFFLKDQDVSIDCVHGYGWSFTEKSILKNYNYGIQWISSSTIIENDGTDLDCISIGLYNKYDALRTASSRIFCIIKYLHAWYVKIGIVDWRSK